MPNLNRVTIIGHVGKDAEVRYTTSGEAVCTFNVATSEKWKDKVGEQQEKTEWHRIVVYGAPAEAFQAKKGEAVYIDGKLQTRKWTDKQGVERYVTEIVCRYPMRVSVPKKAEPQEKAPKPAKTGTFDDFESDVPF